ncbi:MAG: hypothetical protein CBE33_02760 [Candidatus Pelagibacter sp. TMED273]|nr:MAG: hypothetical protein CBE33_02760 [Candidatus Pelagibacter sp. TMED273]
MISILVYIIKLLLNLFVTTILVTDISSEQKNDNKNLKLIIFCSFFTITLTSTLQYISSGVNAIYMIGLALIISFYVVSNLVKDFKLDEKLKVYLISLCSFLFGIGGFVVTFIALIASVISYIILYNSTDFYKFFFTKKEESESDSSFLDENEII